MEYKVVVEFNKDTDTLHISGNGDISWNDTVEFADETKHVVIEGRDIYCSNASNLFANFQSLIDIEGTVNTSTCRDFSYFYSNCENLISPIKELDTSLGEEFDYFHNGNYSLERATFNSTSNGFKFWNMFSGCDSLCYVEGVTIPANTDITTMFSNSIIIERLSYMIKTHNRCGLSN